LFWLSIVSGGSVKPCPAATTYNFKLVSICPHLAWEHSTWKTPTEPLFMPKYVQLLQRKNEIKEQKNFGQTALNIYAEIICDILYNKSKTIKYL
jgi:hypothetical protein